MKLLSIGEAARKFGVSISTLRRWEATGKIQTVRTASGHRRYSVSDIKETFSAPAAQKYVRQESNPIDQPAKDEVDPVMEFVTSSVNSPILPVQKRTIAGVLLALVILASGVLVVKANVAARLFKKIGPAPSDATLWGNDGVLGKVLAAESVNPQYVLKVNVPTSFSKDITAPNIIYSVTAGTGINITPGQNPIISTTDQTASLNIFQSFKLGSDTVTASGKTDSFTFAAGDNVSLSLDTTNKKLTISSTDTATDPTTAGWTDDGSIVRLTSAGDLVSIGTATGAAKLSIDSDTSADVFTASQSGNLLAKLTSSGLLNLTASGFSAGLKLQNASTLFSAAGAPSDSDGNDGDYYFRTDAPSGNLATYTKISGSWTTAGGASTSLQDAYDAGSTITTTNSRDLVLTLANTATDSNLLVNIASGSTGSFQVQNAGSTVTTLNTSGITTSGTLRVDGNLTLGDANSDTITTNGYFSSSLIPSVDVTYDLGSSSNRWNTIYANTIVSGGTGVSGHWQRNNGALFPSNITDDLLLGATSTGSAQIALSGTLGNGTFAGTLQTALFRLTTGASAGYALISDGSGNGSWTDISSSGTAGPWTLSGQSLYPDSASYKLLLGSITAADAIGQFNVSGEVGGKALAILNYTGTDQNILTASASGSTKYTLDASGNASQSGNFTFDSAGFLQSTKNQLLTIGGSTTGNIALSPQGGIGKVNVNGTLELTALRLTTGPGVGYFMTSDGSGNAAWTNTSGSGTFGNWTLTGTTLYPSVATYDVLVGATDTTTAIGKLTVQGDKAGKALTIINSTSSDQNIFVASVSGTTKFVIDHSGNVGVGKSIPDHALDILSSSGNLAQFIFGTYGVDIIQTSNEIKFNAQGNAVLNFGTGANDVFINNPAFNVTTTGALRNNTPSSYLTFGSGINLSGFKTGNALVSLNQATNGDQDLLTASQAGVTKFTVGNTGDITTVGDIAINGGDLNTSQSIFNLINTTATTINFGAAANSILLAGGSASTGCTVDGTTGNFTCSGNIVSGATGTAGYWQRNAGVLSPTFITDDLTLGATSTASATFQAFGSTGGLITSGARIGKALAIFNQTTGGDQNLIVASQAGVQKFTVDNSGNILTAASGRLDTISAGTLNVGTTTANNVTIGNSTSATALNFTSGTGSQTFASSVVSGTTTASAYSFNANALTTGTGMYVNSSSLTTGALFNVASTSTGLTSGNVGLFDWSPSAPATASGDLVKIKIGLLGDTTGNLFNILSDTTSLFSVSETQITSALPHSFTATGDVSVAYDIQFTNQTASYLKSNAPLYIQAGESFESNNLTFQTFNSGRTLIDTNQLGGMSVSSNISAITPAGLFQVNGASTGMALSIFNETGGQDAIVASASGVNTFSVGSGTINVGRRDSTAMTINIATGTGANTVNIGTGGTALQTVNIGNVGSATLADVINIGTSTGAVARQIFIGSGSNNSQVILRDRSAAPGGELATSGQIFIGNIGGNNINSGRIWIKSNGLNYRFNSVSNTVGDYSEYLQQEDTSEPGDVMVLSSTNYESVKRSVQRADQRVLGVVTRYGTSNNGAYCWDEVSCDKSNDPRWANVGLLGQVYTKVSTESGVIRPGDPITTSSSQGVAMKATQAGRIVGYALDYFDGSASGLDLQDIVNTPPAPTWEVTVPDANGGARVVKAGKIIILLQAGWYDPAAPGPENSSGLQIAEDSNTGKYGVTDSNGRSWDNLLVANEAVIGNLKVGKLTADIIQANQIDGLSVMLAGNLAASDANLNSLIESVNIRFATVSAELANLRLEIDPNASLSGEANWKLATESGKLTTLLPVQTSDLTVIGNLRVGLLSFSDIDASISSLTGVITIDGDLAVSGKVRVLGDSIGQAVLPAGSKEIIIQTDNVSSTSAIFVTPNVAISYPLAVTDSTPSASFKVEVSAPQFIDVPFKWWIVN